ncbi:hypothetical protein [Phaeobacter sp. Ax4a-4a]|uniref:hypothetical protein n=1 Tax=Phaeobacter sp. Ax4a-4a TaxID=3112437 RepID=UPI003A8767FD
MSDNDISITVNDVSRPVLCGLCHKPIEWIGEPDTETGEAGCVSCGNTADIKQVAKVAIEFAKDEGQLILNRQMRDVAKGSSFLKFTGQTRHKKMHAFIVHIDGSEFGL